VQATCHDTPGSRSSAHPVEAARRDQMVGSTGQIQLRRIQMAKAEAEAGLSASLIEMVSMEERMVLSVNTLVLVRLEQFGRQVLASLASCLQFCTCASGGPLRAAALARVTDRAQHWHQGQRYRLPAPSAGHFV
jgi:hypothetical protein